MSDAIKTVAQVRALKIAELLLLGYAPPQIAERLGVNQGTVTKAIKKIEEQWKEQVKTAAKDRVAYELAQLTWARSQFQEAWLESKKDYVSSERNRTVELPNQLPHFDPERPVNNNRVTKVSRKTVRRKQNGEAAYLNGAVSVSEQIRKLLGLDATEVKKVSIEGTLGGNLSYDVLVKMDPADLAALYNQAVGADTEA